MSVPVSVIIPTYNRQSLLLDTLASVYAQTLPPREIIVVDDGSADDTQLALHSHRNRIRYVRQTHAGEASARNRGLREASSEYVAFLDSDDLWEPSFLATTVSYLRLHLALAFVGTACTTIPDGKRRPRSPNAPTQGNLYSLLLQRNFLTASAITARRDHLTRVGWFEETLDQATDYDFWLRVARIYPIGFLSEPLCRWRRHTGNVSRQELRHRECVLRVVEKNYDPAQISPRLFRRRLSKLLASLGRIYLRNRRNDEARACLARAVRLFPWHLRPWSNYLVASMKQFCSAEKSHV